MEEFRSEVMMELLYAGMDSKNVDTVGLVLDKIAYRYDIVRKEQHLSVVENDIPELVKIYAACKLSENCSKAGVQGRVYLLRNLFSYTQTNPLTITPNDIRLFLYKYSEERKISSVTLEKYRQMIRCFFDWCVLEKYISDNPTVNLKPIKAEKKQRQPLSAEELEYVRQSCETIREKVIIEILYSTGCRCSELLGLKLKDINLQDNSVHLFGKGQKHRTSYLSAKANILLKEYIKENNITDRESFLFTSNRGGVISKRYLEHIVEVIYDRCREHLHVKLTPHVLRHTLATDMLNKGTDITLIQKILGHSSVSTTMIYAKVSQDDVKIAHSKCIV